MPSTALLCSRATPSSHKPYRPTSPILSAPEGRRGAVFGCALLSALLLISPMTRAAESPEQQLKSIEKRLDESREKEAQFEDQAATLAAEIARLREESIAIAKAAQEHERVLSSLEDQLAVLDDEETRKLAEIKRRRAQ